MPFPTLEPEIRARAEAMTGATLEESFAGLMFMLEDRLRQR